MRAKTNYIFNTDSSALHKIANSYGSELPIIDRYVLRNRRLYLDDKPITHADEILYQGQLDGTDLVVIRDEYNSKSNPWRLFAYSLGHPIQVSKIIVLVIKDGVLKTQKEITRKAASYHWEVKVSR